MTRPLLFSLAMGLAGSLHSASADDNKPAGSLSRSAAQQRVILALMDAEPTRSGAKPERAAEITSLWSEDVPVLDAIALSWAKFNPDVRRLLEQVENDGSPVASLELLEDSRLDPFLRANLGLYIGREMVRRRWLDEGLGILQSLPVDQLADPATFYFHLAVCQTQLSDRKAALASLDRLDKIEGAPQRYLTLARQMRQTVEPLKPETLGGIAHDMRDLRRRLELGRADENVIEREKGVLARLDKLIKDLEEQSKQSQQGGGGNQATAPAQESRIKGSPSEGKAGNRTFTNKDSWGNLPEKDRQRAMQDIGRDYPAHYRDAIEEYFKKLARSKSKD